MWFASADTAIIEKGPASNPSSVWSVSAIVRVTRPSPLRRNAEVHVTVTVRSLFLGRILRRIRGRQILAVLARVLKKTAGLVRVPLVAVGRTALRSEEHTSELQSLMRISSAVYCL